MTNKEIFNLEYNRTQETINYIYLIRNNAGFWRANEWSCYLMYNFNTDLDDEHKLKLSNKPAKGANDNSIISCACKSQSFPKFLPGLTEIKSSDDIKIFEAINNVSIDDYQNILHEFKQNTPVSESSQKETKSYSSPFNEPITFTSIIRKIIRYNIYNRTDKELIEFINELKNDSASLF